MATIAWTVAGSIFLDVSVGLAFRLPQDANAPASPMQRYFDYGRSIEGKLRRLVGPSPAVEASIVKAGWLPQSCDVGSSIPSGKIGFDVYGMSFSNQIADQMEKLDSRVTATRFGGPAAPINHSFACFRRRIDSDRPRAPNQILGILASSIQRTVTIGGLSTSFEGPEPFSYPRYYLAGNDELREHNSFINSDDDLRDALENTKRWRAYIDDLSRYDLFYSRYLFDANVFDQSVLMRMIRRSWAQHLDGVRRKSLNLDAHFDRQSELAPLLRKLVITFSETAKAAGLHPVVLLIEDKGYGRMLSLALAPTLTDRNIDFVATSSIASPDDSANFVADGHFTLAVNETIARVTLKFIDK
jgi:hypothetical protein